MSAKGPKTTFHSWRRNFEDACRRAGVPRSDERASGASERGMASRYGKGHDLKTLSAWMQEIKYHDLDLSHLNAE